MPETLTAPRSVDQVRGLERTETLSETGREVFLKMDKIVEYRLAEATNLIAEHTEGHPDNREIVQLARARQERFLTGLTEDEMEDKGLRLSDVTAERLALLTLEIPFAGEAQDTIAKLPEGVSKDPEAVKVLSQFNHDIVKAIEYMPVPTKPTEVDTSLRSRFPEELWLRAAELYQKRELPIMSRAEFSATVQGAAREAAFVDAVNKLGNWLAVPAPVERDLKGVDVDITDGEIMLGIDLKGGGKFQHILKELREDPLRRKQLRITEADLHFAKDDGIIEVTYGYEQHGTQRVWIVDADRLGRVSLFRYADEKDMHRISELVETLGAVERTELELLRRMGKNAINI